MWMWEVSCFQNVKKFEVVLSVGVHNMVPYMLRTTVGSALATEVRSLTSGHVSCRLCRPY